MPKLTQQESQACISGLYSSSVCTISFNILRALGKVQMQNVMISIHYMTPSSPARTTEDAEAQESNAVINVHDKK